jgi:hypothetical protein
MPGLNANRAETPKAANVRLERVARIHRDHGANGLREHDVAGA